MGEKKMLQKERKSPSQKKSKEAIVPRSRFQHDYTPPFSCPSLRSFWINWSSRAQTGKGGITKSWISPSSSCCLHQTWPQLVVSKFSQETKEIENIPFYFFDGTVAVSGVSSPAFVFYKWDHDRDRPWKMRNCRVTEPFSGENHRYMEFTNLIGFKRKHYAISRQGCLALIEDEGDSGYFEITALGRNRVVPRCKESRHFTEHLLEFNGEIYLVFLLSRASINVVDGVEVSRLDRSRLSWEKVDRLKDDALFFLQDDSCLAISASELGCSKGGNCIYFPRGRADDAWFVYDMEKGCIRPTSGPEVDLPTLWNR